MSLASKITLASATAFALGIISYVHYKQVSDREKLHQGVLNDIERRQRRKAENIYVLQKQKDLEKEFRKAESALQETETSVG
ncbi:protein PET117 homolog, mitochondrial [Euwallacea fornicatus]|uniref:protein PET117 homolog, mitochondrial n=1 Tax=Euwallacea fornicatus TaxID=995702 RepID=UPI00339018E6